MRECKILFEKSTICIKKHEPTFNHLTYLIFSRLRCLNLTRNKLEELPELPPCNSPFRLQELYLSFNHLDDQALKFISMFTRLKVLHVAHNFITELRNRYTV